MVRRSERGEERSPYTAGLGVVGARAMAAGVRQVVRRPSGVIPRRDAGSAGTIAGMHIVAQLAGLHDRTVGWEKCLIEKPFQGSGSGTDGKGIARLW